MKLLIMQFLQSPVTCFLLGPNMFLCTLLTVNLCFSLNVRDQVLNPSKAASRVYSSMVLYVVR